MTTFSTQQWIRKLNKSLPDNDFNHNQLLYALKELLTLKLLTMKTDSFKISLALLSITLLSSCQAVVDIFKTGVNVGIIITVVVLVILVTALFSFRKK